MSAVTAWHSRRYIRSTSVPSGSRCSAKNTPSDSATATRGEFGDDAFGLRRRRVGGQQSGDRVAEPG